MSELFQEQLDQTPVKALLLGLDMGKFDPDRSMDELEALAEADNMEVVARMVQKRAAPETGTVLGAGKLAEAKLTAENLGAEIAIFDGELTGSQMRNLSDALDLEVIDRTLLILEIFKSRAVTNEGKLQTELASERYRLPRLQDLGRTYTRQGGGGGGAAGARRGGGESQLELDRRYVRSRIEMMEQKLAEMEKRRDENRRSRKKAGVPVIALVGYTNVGKSSLMNALCGPGSAAAKDMLFATLDPTARRLILPSGLETVLIDTVGFVSRLPHHLVQAFKSTLEEAAGADVIVVVADACDPARADQLAVTDQVLKELGCADIPRITVYNKADSANSFAFEPDVILTSALNGRGLDTLQAALDSQLADRTRRIQVLLPYDKLDLREVFRVGGSVIKEDYLAEGVCVEGIVSSEKLYLLEPFITKI